VRCLWVNSHTGVCAIGITGTRTSPKWFAR